MASIGLDIGTDVIKVVQLGGTAKGSVLKSVGTIKTPYGAIQNGVINDKEAVAQAVEELFREKRLKAKGVVSAVSAQSVIVRQFTIPKMPFKELKEAIRFEIEQQMPFPEENAVYDYDIVTNEREEEDDSQGIEVILVAAHRDIIQSHLEALSLAKVRPAVIDVQPFGLIRSFDYLWKEQRERRNDKEAVALIDIGAGTTDMTVIANGKLRLTRIIPIAGNEMTEAVSKELRCSVEEGERLKINYGDVTPYEALPFSGESGEQMREVTEEADNAEARFKVNTAVNTVLSHLTSEIRRSIDFFALQNRGMRITSAVIVGGSTRLKGIDKFLSLNLGIDVMKGDSLYNMEYRGEEGEDFDLSALSPILGVSIGLAKRGGDGL